MSKITADKLSISICLDDIPASKRIAHKNGKTYINIEVIPKKEPDQYGKDISVAIEQTKEERESKASKTYIGSGKSFNWTSKADNYNVASNNQNVDKGDGLPF